MVTSNNKLRRSRRAQYRAGSASHLKASSLTTLAQVSADDIDELGDTLQTVAVGAVPAAEVTVMEDAPTIILTADQLAVLHTHNNHLELPDVSVPPLPYARELPPPPTIASLGDEITADQNDAPTIVLDIAALMASPPMPEPLAPPPAASIAEPLRSWPRTPTLHPTPPVRSRTQPDNPDEKLSQLREQRIALHAGKIDRLPEEPYVADKLRQWWHEIQPGLDRVFGRTHRGGVRGARATASFTSAQMPAVRARGLEEDAPAIVRLSAAAQQIGSRAQQAATPALTRLHERAERAAQKLVNTIDERLGGSPPLQHVVVGPGRMIVSFAPTISIRDAQIIIASLQARSLRRLVGYNAYLVIVPPGREARYAERFHTYREVTGVHFGPQRPSSSFVGRLR